MLDNHMFWTSNQIIFPKDQWRLDSLSQNLYRANIEGATGGSFAVRVEGN
jgi:hypothetical protein